MDSDSKFIIRKIVIDLILLAFVGFPILFLFLWGKPFERGFFCDDESLRHPFHPSTVTSTMLYLIGLALPIFLIITTEYLSFRRKKNHKVHSFMGYRILPWIWSSYNVIGVFGFGVLCQQLTTDIAKYTVGRLRPHFFSVCQPDIDCTLETSKWTYHTNFTCKGTDPHLIKEMRLSFPSGHASFSMFTMVYLAVYLQCKMKWGGSKLLKHGFQFVALMLSWFTIMSRVSNYKHHWSDVLGGALIGAGAAVLVFMCISDLWKQQRTPTSPRSRDISEQMMPSNSVNGNTSGMASV